MTIPTFDDRDRAIVTERAALLDAREGVRTGDYVRFADDVVRRVSYVWRDEHSTPFTVQSSDLHAGSYHLSEGGHVSYSGSLHPGVKPDTLTLTDERRTGRVWIFHHDMWQAGNAVTAMVPFRVFRCSAKSSD